MRKQQLVFQDTQILPDLTINSASNCVTNHLFTQHIKVRETICLLCSDWGPWVWVWGLRSFQKPHNLTIRNKPPSTWLYYSFQNIFVQYISQCLLQEPSENLFLFNQWTTHPFLRSTGCSLGQTRHLLHQNPYLSVPISLKLLKHELFPLGTPTFKSLPYTKIEREINGTVLNTQK